MKYKNLLKYLKYWKLIKFKKYLVIRDILQLYG